MTTAILFDVKIERSHRLVSFLPSPNGAGSSLSLLPEQLCNHLSPAAFKTLAMLLKNFSSIDSVACGVFA